MGEINYDELLAFVLVAFALAGSPGPATLSLAATGAAFGFKAARNYLIGIMFGVVLVIIGVAGGVFAAISSIPHAADVMSVIATLYFGYLAYKIATAPPIGELSSASDSPGFLTGFILNLSNPKAYAAFGALFSQFQLIPASPVQSSYFQVLVCFLVVSIVNPTWLLAGNALRPLLQNEKTNRRVNLGFAVLLIMSVIFVVFL